MSKKGAVDRNTREGEIVDYLFDELPRVAERLNSVSRIFDNEALMQHGRSLIRSCNVVIARHRPNGSPPYQIEMDL
jgi:hypothetical protein